MIIYSSVCRFRALAPSCGPHLSTIGLPRQWFRFRMAGQCVSVRPPPDFIFRCRSAHTKPGFLRSPPRFHRDTLSIQGAADERRSNSQSLAMSRILSTIFCLPNVPCCTDDYVRWRAFTYFPARTVRIRTELSTIVWQFLSIPMASSLSAKWHHLCLF